MLEANDFIMRLGENPVEREPILFDKEQIGSRFVHDDEQGVATAFRAGVASFDDELQTAVAAGGAITQAGELDLRVLDAVERIVQHVDGAQGQPFILADTSYDKEARPRAVGSLVGILANTDPLVGSYVELSRSVGLATEIYVDCSVYRAGWGGLEPFYQGSHGVIAPLISENLTVGKPKSHKGEETEARQDFVIGDEITLWIAEVLGEGSDGYIFYRSMITELVRQGSKIERLDPLLVEPFISKAASHGRVMDRLSTTLDDHIRRREAAQQVLAGVSGRTELDLDEIRDEIKEIDLSDRNVSVAAQSLKGSTTSMESRKQHLEGSKKPLDQLLLRARQLGRVRSD